MPRMNGIEAIKKIKLRFPDAKIIVLSAYAAGKLGELKEAGATVILEKPLRRSKVVEAVNNLLK